MRLKGHPDRHLTYCGNVHPTEGADALTANLRRFIPPLRARLGHDGPLGLGLYFGGKSAALLLADAAKRDELIEAMTEVDAYALTANAFPLGDFHAAAVKESVYRPDWHRRERLDYTLEVAALMAVLPTRSSFQSISTLPGTYRRFEGLDENLIAERLRTVSRGLARIESETGRRLILGVEPEPGCLFEKTPEWIAFYQRHFGGHEDEALHRRHLGTCYDTCHQAVEFESAEESMQALVDHEIPIAKIQLSTALRLQTPAEQAAGLARLARFDEPRYLHQVRVRDADDEIRALEDLPEYLAVAATREDREARCHFHVPIFLEDAGDGLKTTRGDLEEAMAFARKAELESHLEIETYSWNAMPGRAAAEASDDELVADIAREYEFALSRLEG